jgi:hypothetical protein
MNPKPRSGETSVPGRNLLRVLIAATVLTAAACSSPIAPTDEPTEGVPCTQPAPEPGMVCRGDTWNW